MASDKDIINKIIENFYKKDKITDLGSIKELGKRFVKAPMNVKQDIKKKVLKDTKKPSSKAVKKKQLQQIIKKLEPSKNEETRTEYKIKIPEKKAPVDVKKQETKDTKKPESKKIRKIIRKLKSPDPDLKKEDIKKEDIAQIKDPKQKLKLKKIIRKLKSPDPDLKMKEKPKKKLQGPKEYPKDHAKEIKKDIAQGTKTFVDSIQEHIKTPKKETQVYPTKEKLKELAKKMLSDKDKTPAMMSEKEKQQLSDALKQTTKSKVPKINLLKNLKKPDKGLSQTNLKDLAKQMLESPEVKSKAPKSEKPGKAEKEKKDLSESLKKPVIEKSKLKNFFDAIKNKMVSTKVTPEIKKEVIDKIDKSYTSLQYSKIDATKAIDTFKRTELLERPVINQMKNNLIEIYNPIIKNLQNVKTTIQDKLKTSHLKKENVPEDQVSKVIAKYKERN